MLIRNDSYPGGFLWIFSVFYYLCEGGKDVRSAQLIFAAIYVATLWIVFRLYMYSTKVESLLDTSPCRLESWSDITWVNFKIPPYAFIFLTLSKRLHSLYILRCFNDCIVALLLYASILALCRRRWTLSSLLFR